MLRVDAETHPARFLVEPWDAFEEVLALHTRPDAGALRLRQVERFNGGVGTTEDAEECSECGGVEQHCSGVWDSHHWAALALLYQLPSCKKWPRSAGGSLRPSRNA